MEYTEGKWEAIRNAVGTHIIQTEYARIGEIDRHFNAKLVVTAVNACISVNPDNPVAVAESIKEMYEALKALKFHFAMAVECIYPTNREVYDRAGEALNKAEQGIIQP